MPVIWALVSEYPKLSIREEEPMNSSRLQQDVMLASLEERGLMLVGGHFDYRNGYHGTSYLTAQPLLTDPAEVIQYAQDLTAKIPSEIRNQVEMVAAPATGGMLFGFAMAIAIDSSRQIGTNYHKLLFVPIYKTDGKLALREFHRTLIAGEFQKPGRRVLVVDDVSNTGLTITRSRKLVEDCGGQVIASAVIYDRQSASVELRNHFSLATCDPDPGLIEVVNCPNCKLHVPITQF